MASGVFRIVLDDLSVFDHLADFSGTDHAFRSVHLPQRVRQKKALLFRCVTNSKKEITAVIHCSRLHLDSQHFNTWRSGCSARRNREGKKGGKQKNGRLRMPVFYWSWLTMIAPRELKKCIDKYITLYKIRLWISNTNCVASASGGTRVKPNRT